MAFFFDDADQHDEADKRVDAQIDVEDHQRQQRAETGRGQTGENRDRVDVAFVQDAEHDVHHHDGDDQQHPQVAERTLERLGRALELRADGGGELLVGEVLHLVDDLAERRAGLQVEGDGGRGKLPVVIDGLRSGFGDEVGQGIERNQFPGGILEVEQGKRARVGLIFRFQFQQHLVFVDRPINGGYPARTVRVVQGILDQVGIDAQSAALYRGRW